MPIDTDAILVRSMQLATVFEWMTTNKLSHLTINFNGESDSGDFDDYVDIRYPDENRFTNEDYRNLQNKLNTYIPTLSGERTLEQLLLHLAKSIEEEANQDVDWCNNNGGNGSVEFILDGEGLDGNIYHHGVCLTVNARVIEYETTYHIVQGLVE